MTVLPLVIPKRIRKKKQSVSDTNPVRGGPSLLLLGGLLGSLGDWKLRQKIKASGPRNGLTLATLLSLLDGLDDANGNSLPHITNGETTERRVLIVGLDTHGLAGDKLGNAGITGLDELG